MKVSRMQRMIMTINLRDKDDCCHPLLYVLNALVAFIKTQQVGWNALRPHAPAPEALLQLVLLVPRMVTPSVCLATGITTLIQHQTPAKHAKQGNTKQAISSKTNNVMITSAHAAMDKKPRGPTAPVTKATYAKAAMMATILIAPAAAL